MLHDFCLSPRLTENPALLYGSLPPNYHLPKPVPTRSQKRSTSAYRFSLAFQCIVNISVRGSGFTREQRPTRSLCELSNEGKAHHKIRGKSRSSELTIVCRLVIRDPHV